MLFAAGYSNAPDVTQAIQEIATGINATLQGTPPDLSFVFVSHHHAAEFDELPHRLRREIGTQLLLGCTAESVIGGGKELESTPALSVWSAVIPESELQPFHLEFSQTPDGIMCSGMPNEWLDDDKRRPAADAVFVLGEPFSSVPESILTRFADDYPATPVMGGMASGSPRPGGNRLFYQDQSLPYGAVGVLVAGGMKIRSIVSQGCRPIGGTYLVTKADRNVVFELGGRPALEQLQSLLQELSPNERRLAQSGLHLGLAMNEYQSTFNRGDFLIANVIGADDDSGALALGSLVRTGQTVQFHVRDAETADEDFTHLLTNDRQQHPARIQAALIFSCNGRGTRMFSEPHHDVNAVQSLHGPIPTAGFFAQGEIGPVAGKNFLHGFTASVALFE